MRRARKRLGLESCYICLDGVPPSLDVQEPLAGMLCVAER